MPQEEFIQFLVQMKTTFTGKDDGFYCDSYNCYFIERNCSDFHSRLSNFTIRFNDTFGYTVPPQVFLRSTHLMAGDQELFPICDVMIRGNYQN